MQNGVVTKTFKYYIYNDNSSKNVIDATGITFSQFENIINRWNNISDENGDVHVELTRTSAINNALIKVYMWDIGSSARSRAIPSILIDGSESLGEGYIHNTWYGNHIQLNSNPSCAFGSITTNEAKYGVIAHEFGHALKLAHPYGETASGYIDQVVYSAMNQGVYQDAPLKVRYYPTDYSEKLELMAVYTCRGSVSQLKTADGQLRTLKLTQFQKCLTFHWIICFFNTHCQRYG